MIWNKALLLGTLALNPLPEITAPSIPLIDNGSPLGNCLKDAILDQAPDTLFADTEILLSGPAVRSDLPPRGSVVEIVFVAKKGRQWPAPGTYITLTAWLETTDQSLWEEITVGDQLRYRAKAFSNPVKVFNRVGLQHILDLDLSVCDPLLR